MRAVVHRKGRIGSAEIHAPALWSAAICNLAADNAAAVHNERGIVADVHTAAAITISVIRFSRSSGDHAAGDGLCAASFIQHPQAVAVRGKFMPRGRITVRNRQRTTAFHHKDAVTICIVFILEYMTVQVKGHSSIDNQRGVNGNVSCQFDGFIRSIGQRGSQICRRGNFCRPTHGQHRRGQTAQRIGRLYIAGKIKRV